MVAILTRNCLLIQVQSIKFLRVRFHLVQAEPSHYANWQQQHIWTLFNLKGTEP